MFFPRRLVICHRGVPDSIVDIQNDVVDVSITETRCLFLHDKSVTVFDHQKQGKLPGKPLLAVIREHGFPGDSIALCMLAPLEGESLALIGMLNGSLLLYDCHLLRIAESLDEFDQPICQIKRTPISGLVAVLFSSGILALFHLHHKKCLLQIQDAEKITAYSFFGDSSPYMVVGLENGALKLWDLEQKRSVYSINAHSRPVVSACAFGELPLFATSSSDNSIKVWERSGQEVRLLRSREGHYKPAKQMSFYGEDGLGLITAARDGEIRLLSLQKDSRSVELSQGSIDKQSKHLNIPKEAARLPPINCFATYQTKSIKWANMVSCHQGMNCAFSWKVDNHTITDQKFLSSDHAEMLSAAISPCGNFAAFGTALGTIDLYSLQSAILKRSTDPTGTPLISLHFSYNSKAIFATFAKGSFVAYTAGELKPLTTFEFPGPIRLARFLDGINLFALAFCDFSLSLFDPSENRVVRKFNAHQNHISDICLTSDSKFLLTASLDASIKVWDMESALCLQTMAFSSVPVCVAASPTLEFLAISFASESAVHIWSRNSLYIANDSGNAQSIFDIAHASSGFLTLKGLDRARWLRMVNFSTILENNRPVFSESMPVRVPFFLESFEAGVAPEQSVPDDVRSQPVDSSLSLAAMTDEQLERYIEQRPWTEVAVGIASLASTERASVLRLLDFIHKSLCKPVDFECKMGLLNVTLKAHFSLINADHAYFGKALASIEEAIERVWTLCHDKLQASLGLIAHCRQRR